MHSKKRLLNILIYGLPVLFLSACAQLSTVHYSKEVDRQGLQRHIIQANAFPLVYYSRPDDKKTDTLHVYIGGDGIPWQNKIFKSEDPGPYHPLVLQLMKQDRQTSIYLGRPCYQGLAKLPPCQPKYWTSSRFSHEVVDSMAAALKQLQAQYQYKKLALFGYSGGGALAVLLAHQLPRTELVVTIAGNLDTEAWTAFHYYSPMDKSINPARQAALPVSVRQIHLQGDRDINIPPQLSARYIKKQHDVTVLNFAAADHTCCWHLYWPEFLSVIKNATTNE